MGNKPKNRKNLNQQAFGLKVRLKRFDLGITQEKLAELCSLHPTYIGSIERGERNVSLAIILSISKALECSPKDFMPD